VTSFGQVNAQAEGLLVVAKSVNDANSIAKRCSSFLILDNQF
jgi:hypothetical protein